ncbi:MAG TPA: hypothetical protein EYG92_00645 [Lutibacter sp.]|nr:hypothetical protein [Lutibacter sp.]
MNSEISERYDYTITFGNYFFNYIKFNKFENDRFFLETENYILGLDGVILNLQDLKKQYAISSFPKLIVSLFEKENTNFISKLKGEFSGFIFEKKSQQLYFYNNKTATKQVFYSQFKESFVIAPTLEAISKARTENNVKNSLNINATYNLLTFGGMIENQTLVSEIYKLGGGEYLVFKDDILTTSRYYDFNKVPITINTKKKAVAQINEVFIDALHLEYQKDEEYNYNSIATLSGGLDSRMNVMLAQKLGYKSTTFCFSQSNYADETIARKIANDLNLDFKFIPLDDGDYLKNLSQMVSINNGLQFYHGSAHYNFALQQLDLSNYGLIHTGQIGDGILGGFVSTTKEKDFLSQTISKRFIDKVAIDQSLLDSYRDEEVFKLYQRVFNVANFGSYMVEHHQTYLVSPFMDTDVIETALSIAPNLKYNQDIYIDWMNQLHPEVTNYIWERTGFKPNKKWKTVASRYTNKIKKEYFIATKQKNKLSMNPLEYWLESNKSINLFYEQVYNENIALLQPNMELFTDIKNMFKIGSFNEKALVLTLLEIIRKLNLHV